MMVETCAGPTNPSMAIGSGSSRMARIATGVSTWLQKMLKFVSPFCIAWRSAMAVGGVVVSKPMAKNTTCDNHVGDAGQAAFGVVVVGDQRLAAGVGGGGDQGEAAP